MARCSRIGSGSFFVGGKVVLPALPCLPLHLGASDRAGIHRKYSIVAKLVILALAVVALLCLFWGLSLLTGTASEFPVQVQEEVAADFSGEAALPRGTEDLGAAPSPGRGVPSISDPANEGEPPTLAVRVSDTTGGPLSGATVYSLGEEDQALLGATDSEGLLSVELPRLVGSEIGATLEGYGPVRQAVPDPLPRGLDLVLQPAKALAGIVVTGDGSPVGTGVSVLVWPEERWADDEEARRSLRGDPTVLTTCTNDEGRFSVQGLVPGRVYYGLAAGKGYGSADLVRNILSGEEECILTVQKIYATWLRLREADGSIPRISDSLWARHNRMLYGQVLLPANASSRISGNLSAVWLNDNSHVAGDGGLTFFDRVYAFAAEDSTTEIGAARFRAEFPGYEPVDAAFPVPSLANGIGETVLELVPVAGGFGELIIDFQGVPDMPGVVDDKLPLGIVTLWSDGRENRIDLFVFTKDLSKSSRLRFGPIPYGHYECVFTVEPCAFSWPPEGAEPIAVDITCNPAELAVDLSALGGCHVRILRGGPEAPPYRGKASLRCMDESGKRLAGMMFGKAPYVLYGLEPGVYTVYLDQPRVGEDSASRSHVSVVVFDILPGQITEVDIFVPLPF